MNMIKKSLLAVALSAALASPAWSASLSFNPSSTTLNVGGGVDVELLISGLDTQVGFFDLAVNFDSSVLSLTSFSLGSNLGSLANLDSYDWSAGLIGLGKVNLSQVSMLNDLSGQPSAFSLGTLHFAGTAQGYSLLSYSNVSLTDASGNTIAPVALNMTALTVAAVPEPETYAMLLGGLGLLGFARRRSLTK